jgi:hypothetical protein
MGMPDFDAQLGGVFDTLSKVTQVPTAIVAPLDSTGVDLDKVIDDAIYGLVSLDEMTAQQIMLLSALMQGRG